MWIGVAIVLAVGGAFVLWMTGTDPRTYDHIVSLDQSPAGNAVFLAGSAPHRRGIDATFALKPATGESDRIMVPAHWGVSFSRDGRYAAFIEPGMFRWSRGEVIVRDLTTGENKALGPEANLAGDIVLSDDGRNLAIRDGGTISVFERSSGKLLAAMPAESRTRYAFFFTTPESLRVISYSTAGRTETQAEISELDVRTKQRRMTGTATTMPRYNAIASDAGGARLLLRDSHRIVDGRTGAAIATLPGDGNQIFSSAMLSDGRVLLSTRGKAGASTLGIYSRDGVLEHEVPLPFRTVWVVGERSDDTIVLLGFTKTSDFLNGANRTMLLVDVARGAIVKSLPNVKGPWPYWSPDPRLIRYDAKAKLAAVDASGKLTYWN
jgi:hypothetical protein